MPGGTDRELEKRYRAAAVFFLIVIAAAAGLTIYAGFFLPPPVATSRQADLTPVWILIIFIAAGSFVLRRVLFRWERFRDRKLLSGQAGLLKSLQVNAFILGGIGGLIALLGFIASSVSGDRFDMARAAVVALIVLAINFPRRSIWVKLAESVNEI